ncbi:MAG: preprotein translocase subunit SecE [Bacilli bacterium]|jgi:preprotein translocase SecE subunit|nr:preprotein translocase subunit SecE [Bacilli bacterium]
MAKQKKEKKRQNSGYFKEVRSELKKVTFPSFKSVMKYTLATLLFCGILVVFFLGMNLLLSLVKGMF